MVAPQYSPPPKKMSLGFQHVDPVILSSESSYHHFGKLWFIITLPKTNIAPTNRWLEYDPFLLGFGLFSGAFAVSFREGTEDEIDMVKYQPIPLTIYPIGLQE